MYQALYRKWRPKTFDDVIGQDHITKTLKSEVMSGRISHAYLFTGSRGTGKTSCAKILAKAVNCLGPVDGNPCLNCEICKSIESETVLDVVEIDAASNNGVENIRSMREEVVFSPTKCKYRVYIVDEVHMLSTGAFNAFLKVLEEPPAHVIFVLATTEVHKLPSTIVSRCQRFDFYRITPEDILKRIKYICEKENVKIDDGAAKIISQSADGAMRDALSILDQCANACQNNVDDKSVKKILGITGSEYVSDMASFIFNNNPAECLNLIDKMHRESKNMLRFCEEITEYFRNLMICKATGNSPTFKSKEINLNKIDLDDILRALDILQGSYKNMNGGANKKLEAEIAVVKLCNEFKSDKNIPQAPEKKAVTEKRAELKKTTAKTAVPKKTEPPKIEPIQPKVQEVHLNSSEETLPQGTNALEYWAQILETLKNTKSLKSLYISLRDSSAYERGNYILIDSSNSLAFELLRRDEYRIAIKKIIKEVTGKQYNLGPYTSENEKHTEPKKPDPFDKLIKNANSSGIEVKLI